MLRLTSTALGIAVLLAISGCVTSNVANDRVATRSPTPTPTLTQAPDAAAGYLAGVTGDIVVTCRPGADGHISVHSVSTGQVLASVSVNFSTAVYETEYGQVSFSPLISAGPFYCLQYTWDASLTRILGTAQAESGIEVPAVLDFGGRLPEVVLLEPPVVDNGFSAIEPQLLHVAFAPDGVVWWLTLEGGTQRTLSLHTDDGRTFQAVDPPITNGMAVDNYVRFGLNGEVAVTYACCGQRSVSAYRSPPDMVRVETDVPWERASNVGRYLYEQDIFDLIPATDYRIGEGIAAPDGRVAFLAAAPNSPTPSIFIAAPERGEPTSVVKVTAPGEGLLYLGQAPG